jgi:hypothetical protein
MQDNIKFLTNEKLIRDLEKFINEHKQDIYMVITQYRSAPVGQLFTVTLEFHPVWMELENKENLKN